MTEVPGEIDSEADVDVFEQSQSEQLADLGQHWTSLPASTMLSLEDADQLLRWRAASVIAIVGERNGGKTTLVTEIYEQFLRGPFAGAFFCDSLSLQGFEQKSFLSRAESGEERPDTPRTSGQDGLLFFHLALCDTSNLRIDLLISERAGEAYRGIRDEPKLASEMIEVLKASAVVFIIDGERVADPRRRSEAFASVRNMIRAIVDTGNIAPQARVQLVTTKCDLLEGDLAADARGALSEFEGRISSILEGRYEVTTFRTAARDPEGTMEPAKGVTPLLQSWLGPAQISAKGHFEVPDLNDEFDRLLLRRNTQ